MQLFFGVIALLSSRASTQLFLQSAPATAAADLAVYGATGAGCVAALAAKRSGAGEVVLLSQTGHIGGMLTGGLQHTDSANDTVIQGITREFFVRAEQQYLGRPTDASYPPGHSPPGWLFESHVGERVLMEMLAEANVTVLRNVVNVAHAATEGGALTSITLEGAGGAEVTAKVWIDASYEGDLLDRAGASMTWGRESTSQYGEKNAGRQGIGSIGVKVNPYWDATEDPPRVLPHVKADIPVQVGGEDRWTEPYDFRLCLTNSPGNRFSITKPASYNASEWELWRRIYKASPPKNLGQAGLGCLGPIPNNYSDCGGKSCKKCDMLGMNHGTDMTNGADGYPNGTTGERQAIWKAHVEFTRGLLWFWMSDPAVPDSVQREIAELGHCTDEYDAESDPPYWPHQLYVREAKRLVGDWVWTQFLPTATLLSRSIGLGSYSFDCHTVSRIVDRSSQDLSKHIVVKEGRVDVHKEQVNGTSDGQYACVGQRCILMADGQGTTTDAACDGECDNLSPQEWLAVRALSDLTEDDRTMTVRTWGGKNPTFLKKSETLAAELPQDLVLPVYDGQVLNLTRSATVLDSTYHLVELDTKAHDADDAAEAEFELGNVQMPPYQIPYDVLLPKRSELTNVLSAVAISASHVRFNAIRMEPTWMIMGQAAGTAAAMAFAENIKVQDVDVPALQKVLLQQKQKLEP